MNATIYHPPLYTAPPLRSEDEVALGEIHQMRKDLRHVLRTPRRWEDSLRRSALARNIQGSNSIEGYDVDEDDAAAAIDGEEPFSADEQTFLEIAGYRLALGYVLAMSDADYATFDTTELRAPHYMMLSHDLSKSPGRYRRGPIYVHDDRNDKVVYEGPDAADVPALMEALAASLHSGHSSDPVIRSAMAHLNLVVIHPFRDGNGRMARALATLVLTRSDIGEPEFSSIARWVDEAAAIWAELDQLATRHGLPDRAELTRAARRRLGGESALVRACRWGCAGGRGAAGWSWGPCSRPGGGGERPSAPAR
jgi:Fic family protein